MTAVGGLQPDGVLARRHLEGDAQAFGGLVDRYQGRLLTFVHRSIGDRDRAEELVQEVFIRAFRRLRRFDRTERFSTWIYTIASNLVVAQLGGGASSFEQPRHESPPSASLSRLSSR